MAKNKVLVVDDDATSLKILSASLQSAGYEVMSAENGKKAIEKYVEDPVHVVISDLEMPQMGGLELIQALKKINFNPIVLVQTAHHDSKTVIDIMKQGVFDYLIKPVDKEYLRLKVEKAFEVAYFRELQNEVAKEYNLRLDHQMTWNAWKESVVSRDRDRFDRTLFHNLKTILAQGAGFGGLLSILSLITGQPKTEDGHYKVSADIMNLLLENSKMAQKAIDSFSEIDDLLNTEGKMVALSLGDIHDLLQTIISNNKAMIQHKNQRVSLSDQKPQYNTIFIKGDKDLLGKAFQELIINALKFAPDGSSIYILMSIMRQKVFISFLNETIKWGENQEGIPEKYEQTIFEPFFRLGKTLDERFGTLDFGLGLTVVDKIIRLHGGEIRSSNISSHLDPLSRGADGKKVKIEVQIPVIEE